MSLRLKLLLVASVLLAVPLVGYRYVVAVEQFLREHQAQAALESARTLALALGTQANLLPPATAEQAEKETLFVHPVARPLQIDGYDDDWAVLAISAHASAANLRAASDGKALFILLKVTQASRTAAPPLRLVLEDSPAFRRAWLLDARVPGSITVLEVPPAAGLTRPAHPDARLQAAAQGHGTSLVYEMRIPLSVGIHRLSFEILAPPRADTREPVRFPQPADGAGDMADPQHLATSITARVPRRGVLRVRFAPQELAQLLHSWAPGPGRRLRVVDAQARVIAQAGDIARAGQPSGVRAALEQFVESHEEALLTLAPVTLKLTGDEVSSALGGTPAVRVRRAEADGPLVVSAAWPLRRDERPYGALILEENTSPAQALARHALLELAFTAGATFLLGAGILLLVSGRIVARLRALRDQAAHSVDDSGRVLQAFHASPGKDEIGDLARSFKAAVTRLRGYQDYLEKLAQRLSHELRTPLTVIRSSLDNLGMSDTHEEDAIYLHRARIGVERLESIVRRMSEAARLEQAMADSQRGPLDLCEVLRAVLPSYQQSWPDRELQLHAPPTPCPIDGSADLLVQALDKLLANARDFADPQTLIHIRLCAPQADSARDVRLMVCNTGPRLPAGDPAQLFESMSSQRSGSDEGNTEAHLGFGLYVVRLVAQFHGGKAFAHDDADSRTVCIGLQLPRRAR